MGGGLITYVAVIVRQGWVRSEGRGGSVMLEDVVLCSILYKICLRCGGWLAADDGGVA